MCPLCRIFVSGNYAYSSVQYNVEIRCVLLYSNRTVEHDLYREELITLCSSDQELRPAWQRQSRERADRDSWSLVEAAKQDNNQP